MGYDHWTRSEHVGAIDCTQFFQELLRGDPPPNQTRKKPPLCEEPLGFGTAKEVVASGAVTVPVPRR